VKYKRDDAFIKKFGKNLKELRRRKKISQEELAYRTGLELSQIGRIERGTINTSISNIYLIALALDVAPADLFSFS
jgi:transcriptional regulator with XRE-family HTH domain